ncbi:DUF1641 domain-containing protein [Acidianus sulfidivorans JP7]|uniref:DUF1641 domain-containing protein n=1 Tax=Acidianus sulfidivorans JP7 TaxID=619593 RepID=A0A2U9IM09_9CREN|nr:DUF1641 domain-containing protein [Acidianus sulfidivorans]AWR97035.1 DUF1641 domain-containing protein [Acidianus sulfidivorans JP7]
MSDLELSALDNLLTPDKLMSLNHVLDLLEKLDKMGIIDVISGILSDDEYMGKIMGAIVNDNTLELLGKWNNMMGILTFLSDEDTLNSLKTVLSLVKDLNKSGILDPIIGILKDEETLGKIVGGLVNDFTMNLLTNWNQIMSDLSKMDLTNFKYYTQLINSVGEAIKVEKVKPLGLGGLLSALRDPDVQKGMGILINIVKHIGQNYKS